MFEPSSANRAVSCSGAANHSGNDASLQAPRTFPTIFGDADSWDTKLAVYPGDLFAGQYRVICRLGAGGMGMVLSAQHVGLDVPVAIKVLLPHLCGEKDAIAQFAREVWAVAQMENEHVARVFDVGTLDSGAPFMVMELLEGEDLEGWLHHHGPLPVEDAVDIVLQACEGIAEAHALGIVHRDVKPANLFVTRRLDGSLCIKVLDFGISITNRTLAPRSSARAPSHMPSIAGTPLYMSPEQMDAPDDVDGRTDIWALGICLYELITGLRPFSGRTLPAIRCIIGSATPPPMRDARPDVPDGIERVIGRCLGKHRHSRYGDVPELAMALLDFAPPRCRPSIERIWRIGQSRAPSEREQPAPEISETRTKACAPLSKSRTSIMEAAEGLATRATIGSRRSARQ
jgi:serine/threonine protein kinase